MTDGAPRLARWLLSRAAPADERAYLLGDLDEELVLRARDDGARAARRWYWRQALASLPHLLAERAGRARRRAVPTAPQPEASSPMWRALPDDLRHAARRARTRPLASTVVILTAVLAIGVTTAVFSVVNAVLLTPLPFRGAERVVELGMVGRPGRYFPYMAWPDLADYRREAPAFEAITAVNLGGLTLAHGGDAPRRLDVAFVDSSYARVFALVPALGRLFAPSEFEPGNARSVLLSWELWRDTFGGDSMLVGRTVILDDTPYLVAGVLPPRAYAFPSSRLDALAPLAVRPGSGPTQRGCMCFQAAGRVRAGVPLERARAEAREVERRIAAAYPDANGGLRVRATPLLDAVVGDVRGMLALLSAAVAAVLLVASVNTANLLLAQSLARGREFAVRAAIGGTPARLRRQLLTESALLATVGGAIGVALAPLLTRALVALYPGELPRAAEIGVDGRVLLAGVAMTALVALLSGLPTARRAAALDLTRDLRAGRATESRRQRGLGRALVATQIALSLALVFAAGLLLRSFAVLSRVDPGFDPAGVTAFSLYATPARHPATAGMEAFYQAVRTSIAAIPGVERVATATDYPLSGTQFLDVFIPEERGDRGKDNPQARIVAASAELVRALGVPLVRGRTFDARDRAGSPRAALVNEALARRDYPGVDPVGRRVQFQGGTWEIVGVVGSTYMRDLVSPAEPQLLVPDAQLPWRRRFVLVKSALPPDALLRQLHRAVAGVDPTVALTGVTTLDARLAEARAPQRFRAALVGGLGVAALLLATLGLYGLVGHAVSRRTREMGVRMALGAEAGRVRGLVVADALRLALGGTAAGVVLALVVGRSLGAYLVGVSGHDVGLLAAAGGTMLLVAVIAAFVPARRASRVDATTVLRAE